MRIISLCPSLTELVFDLGRGEDLVGRTRFCVHPADGVLRIEKLGGTKNPKVDRIIDLAPDIVLMNEEENRLEDARALAAAGINCHVSFPRDAGDTARMVRDIGAALERPDAAENIAREIERRAERVRADSAGAPTLRYVYLIWRDPIMIAGGDTFVSGILALAGGVNAFAHSAERYPSITAAELAAADPQAVFLSSEPFPFAAKHVEELASLTGISPKKLHLVDGEYLSWHGSRTPAGIDYAEQVVKAARRSIAVRAERR